MIPGDGSQLSGQAQAAIEAFMAGRPGDPGRVTLRLLTPADQDEFLGLVAASAPGTSWSSRASSWTRVPGRCSWLGLSG